MRSQCILCCSSLLLRKSIFGYSKSSLLLQRRRTRAKHSSLLLLSLLIYSWVHYWWWTWTCSSDQSEHTYLCNTNIKEYTIRCIASCQTNHTRSTKRHRESQSTDQIRICLDIKTYSQIILEIISDIKTLSHYLNHLYIYQHNHSIH